jgi:hypothetical protein
MARVGVSQGVHDPLLAQVLVLDDANRRTALVAMDVLAVGAAFADTLRLSLATLLTMNPNAVLVCASHTHAGPAGLQDWFAAGTGTPLNLQIMEMLQARVMTAAQTALSRLAPARLAYSVGEVTGIGTDRNRPVPAADPSLTVLHVESTDGTPIAIAFHYACHPTVLGPQLDYSADFPGAARRRIRASVKDTPCLYLNGAAGNISTRFTRREQTFNEVERFGRLLGDRVLALLETPQYCYTALRSEFQTVDLPLRAFTTGVAHNFAASGNQRIDQTRAEGAAIEARLAQSFGEQTAIQAPLSSMQIGPWKLLTVPGEAFNELAADLRQKSRFALVVGYANDYLGYFPTQQAIDDKTYEALSSAYDARALGVIRTTLEGWL